MSRRRFLQTVGGGCAISPFTSRSGAVDQAPPSVQPIFSYPTPSGTPDTRHEDVLIRLLNRAVPETSVYASIFTFSRDRVAEAFIEAAERGVDINILIDDEGDHLSATQLLRDTLPDQTTIVTDGGIGDRHNHNKFAIFEELSTGHTDVIWQSSSNLTTAQTTNHNCSVVIRNDESLFDSYQTYWDDLVDDDYRDLSYNRTVRGESATAYFSPRDDYDTHLEALKRIDPSWETEIHFMQSIWTASREEESQLIQTRLAELVDAGCEVKAIVQNGNEVLDTLAEAGVDTIKYPGDTVNVHSKYMIIESDFDIGDSDTEHRKEVWVGSQNLSRPGLRRNDEALLRFVGDYVYNEFRDDWERVFQQAQQVMTERRATPTRRPKTLSPTDQLTPSDSRSRTGTPEEAIPKSENASGADSTELFGIITALVGGAAYTFGRRRSN